MPENRLLRQLTENRISCNPAAQLASALANRFAQLCECLMARECRNSARDGDRQLA
jgi:hypothetical protein